MLPPAIVTPWRENTSTALAGSNISNSTAGMPYASITTR